jgi:hypothetical protein
VNSRLSDYYKTFLTIELSLFHLYFESFALILIKGLSHDYFYDVVSDYLPSSITVSIMYIRYVPLMASIRICKGLKIKAPKMTAETGVYLSKKIWMFNSNHIMRGNDDNNQVSE